MSFRPDPAARPPQVGPEDCVVLFDGVCELCSSGAQFLLRWDRAGHLKLCAIQSDAGQAILRWCGLPSDDFDTMVFVERGTVHLRSTAVLRIAAYLTFPWPLALAGLIAPQPLRDWLYAILARNRYRWFGQRESCLLPTPEVRGRFLM